MGKGNRSRIERANEIVVKSEKTKNQGGKNSAAKLTTIATIVASLLLVACLVLLFVVNVVPLWRPAATSNNFTVSKDAMSFLLYTQYDNFLNQYGAYASYFGIDTSTSLKAQWQDKTNGITWFDYFATSAKNQVEELLICCEAAKAAGMELTEEDKAEIEKYIEDFYKMAEEGVVAYEEAYLKNNSVEINLSVGDYIEMMYGEGVGEGDIRDALEISYLAQNWKDKWTDETDATIKDSDLETFVENNKSSFYKADYMSYSFRATLSVAGSEATAEEKAAYEAEKTAMKALADALLAAATDADAFKAHVKSYIIDTLSGELFDQYYEEESESLKDDDLPAADKLATDKAAVLKYVKELIEKVDADAEEDEKAEDKAEAQADDDKKEEDDTPKAPTFDEKTAYGKAMKKVCDDLAKDMESEYVAITTEGKAYVDPTGEDAEDLDKWTFAADRKAGDKEILKEEGEKSSTYTVVLMNKSAYINEDQTRDVAHILFTKDKYETEEKAKAEAERVLALYKNGINTLEAFEALGKEYTEDSGVKYENVKPGDMVEEFNDWMFDEARKVGDVDIVKTTYGYHIMYYVGEGDIAWKADARDGLLDEKYSAWCDEQAKVYNIEFNDNTINLISGR